eukprot:IDg12515t1
MWNGGTAILIHAASLIRNASIFCAHKYTYKGCSRLKTKQTIQHQHNCVPANIYRFLSQQISSKKWRSDRLWCFSCSCSSLLWVSPLHVLDPAKSRVTVDVAGLGAPPRLP